MNHTTSALTLVDHVLWCEPEDWHPTTVDPLLFRCALHTKTSNGLRFAATCPVHKAIQAVTAGDPEDDPAPAQPIPLRPPPEPEPAPIPLDPAAADVPVVFA